MKKLLSISLMLFAMQTIMAQLVLTNQNNGIIAVEYGASNDYSLYDPQGDTEIYLYLWINTDQTNPNLSMVYNDDWNDSVGLVVLNFDTVQQKFTGTIDFNTHDFAGEGVLPQGIQINDFNLILRNQAGNRQTADLLASSYGFQPTTTNNLTEIKAAQAVYFNQDELIFKSGYSDLKKEILIYNINGQLLAGLQTQINHVTLSQFNDRLLLVKIIFDKKTVTSLKILH